MCVAVVETIASDVLLFTVSWDGSRSEVVCLPNLCRNCKSRRVEWMMVNYHERSARF
jgi:hypothetical protein